MVAKAEDYRWSSYREKIGLEEQKNGNRCQRPIVSNIG